MRRLVTSILMVLMMTTCYTTATHAKSRSKLKNGYYYTNGVSNIRTGPSEDYEILDTYPGNLMVYVSSRSGDWYYVSCAEDLDYMSGWTHRDNLKSKPSSSKSRSVLSSGFYRLNGKSNIRSGPGEEYYIVGVLPGNTNVYVESRNGNWYYIEGNGIAGWTHRDNLKH